MVLGIVLIVLAAALVLAFGVGMLTSPGEAAGLGERLFGLLNGFIRAALNAAGVIVLICIGVAAITFKSWWRHEQDAAENEIVQQRIDSLASETERRNEDGSAERVALDESSRAQIDSLRKWIEARAEARADGETRQHLDRARAAWQEAKSGLPKDLSEYERRVALKELKSTIHSWFGLTQAELAEVTQDS